MSDTPTQLMKPETRDRYLKALNELVGVLSPKVSKVIDTADFCQRHQLKPSFFGAMRDLDALVYDFQKSDIDLANYTCTPKLIQLTPEQVSSQMRASGRAVVKANREIEANKAMKEAELQGEADANQSAEQVAAEGLKQAAEALNQLPPVTPLATTLESVMQDAELDMVAVRKGIIECDSCESKLTCLGNKGCAILSDPTNTINQRTTVSDELNQVHSQASAIFNPFVHLSDSAMGNPIGPGRVEMISPGRDFDLLPLLRPYNIDIEASGLRLNMTVETTEDATIVDALILKLNRQTVTTV